MERSRTLIWGGALFSLVAVSLVGAAVFDGGVVGMATGEGGGCNGPAALPEVAPDDLHASDALARPAVTDGPTDDVLEDFIVDGVYVVQIDPTAAGDVTLDASGSPILATGLREQLDVLQAGEVAWAVRGPAGPRILRELQANGDGTITRGPIQADAWSSALGRAIVIPVPGERDAVLAALAELTWVEWAEPMIRFEVASGEVAAKADPRTVTQVELTGYQWTLATMRAPELRVLHDGEGVTVALLDTGVEAHEDGFAHLDEEHCFDLIGGGVACEDPHGHGTHVAGIIGARAGNGVGIDGLAPGARLVPVRIANPEGHSTAADLVSGLAYAVDEGADVISVGVGSYLESNLVRMGLAYAEQHGAVVVAPAGNDAYRDAVMFPANEIHVIGVGAVDMSVRAAPYTNHGKGVDVWAPGGDLSIDDDGDELPDGAVAETRQNGTWGYYAREGTSVATAHVVAAVAIARGAGITQPSVLRELLFEHAAPVSGLEERGITVKRGGLVDVVATLEDFRTERPLAGDGATCGTHTDCASGHCEGQGCGQGSLGTCAPVARACTADLFPYCGCDGTTFFASSTCPNTRYDKPGACE